MSEGSDSNLSNKFKITILSILSILLALSIAYKLYRQRAERRTVEDIEKCGSLLPPSIHLTTEYCRSKEDRNSLPQKATTVSETLIQLGAYCKDGKILDYSGKEIRFHWVYERGGKGMRSRVVRQVGVGASGCSLRQQ